MAIKESNEITLKAVCEKEALVQNLIEKGFEKAGEFLLDDYYFIPEKLDIRNMPIRDILSKAVIIRNVFENNECRKKITYKTKKFNSDGEILEQSAVNCDIYNSEDGKKLLRAIGFNEIMNIKEADEVYCKGNLSLAIKDIVNGDILIEVETNADYDTVDKLKAAISKLGLPVQPEQYFIKKAEIELEKALNR